MAAESIFAFRKVTTFFGGMTAGAADSMEDLQWIQTCAVGIFKRPQIGQFMEFNSARTKLELINSDCKYP